MDARVSSLHEAIEIVCASPHVGQRCVTHHHGCVDRLFMRTREEEVTLEVILYEYSRRTAIWAHRYVGQRRLTATGANGPENNYFSALDALASGSPRPAQAQRDKNEEKN